MPYLQLEGQQYPLVAGENAVGSGANARVRLAGGGIDEVSAVVVVSATGDSFVKRGGEQGVKVNGVVLGVEPSPLLHGDKLEIGGRELFFGDDKKAGNTLYVPNVKLPAAGASSPMATHKPTAATGGRINSLVDGREYPIPAAGLVIGRDPACDVVVSSTDVSRKHAVIAPTEDGYVITDTSTNGILLNGARLGSPTRLGGGDVIELGGEEFRFHADRAAGGAAPGAAVATAEAPRAVLATIEITSSGMLKGKKFEIRYPLTHLGRGPHNEVVIADESVSDAHAKLQRREGGWFVVDMASTNGTYVGGKRVVGEQQLVGAPDVRLGGVKFIFRAVDSAETSSGGATKSIAALRPAEPKGRSTTKQAQVNVPEPTPPRSGAVAPKQRPVTPAPKSRGVPVVLWFLVVLALGALVLYLLTGR